MPDAPPVHTAPMSSHGVLAQALAFPSQMISTNQFKNGTHIEVDGTVFKIVEFQHVKPGKGGAFVRTKLKRVDDGAVIDRTFRAGEKFRPVRTEVAQDDSSSTRTAPTRTSWTSQTYEQMAVPEEAVAESLKWVMPNEEVEMLYVDEPPERRPGAERRRAERRPRPSRASRGDTASRRRRQAGHARVRRRRCACRCS